MGGYDTSLQAVMQRTRQEQSDSCLAPLQWMAPTQAIAGISARS